MSSVILTNWTVYYAGDAGGDLQIRWTGTTGTNTVVELYSALQDLFDITAQMNDGTAISANTPTDFTIGLIDAGETDPWFIDPESIKHLTGAGISTQSWTRITTTNIGIVKLAYTVGGGTDFVSGDLGKTVTHSVGGDSGTLLYFGNGEAWIRPDSNAAANDWDSTGGNINVTAGSGANLSQDLVATTGENLWSNIYSIGSLISGTQAYIAQSDAVLSNTENSGFGAWWGTDHIDVLILTTEQDTVIDAGYVTVYVRDYGDTFDHFQAQLSGGRTPIPINTTADKNNTTLKATVDAYGITFAYADDYTADISDGAGAQPYDVNIDCNGKTVDEVYEYFKSIVSIGTTTNIDTAGGEVPISGELFNGAEVQVAFSASSAQWTLPITAAGGTSLATGRVIGTIDLGTYTGEDAINLTNVKGTFQSSESITGSGTNTASTITSISVPKSSPLGTFAGGKLFCSQGIWLSNLAGTEAINYELIDSNGVTRKSPFVPVSITTKNENGVPVEGIRVAVYATSNITEGQHIMNTTTDALGVAIIGNYAYSGDTAITIRVRSSTTGTKYFPVNTTGTITNTGFSTDIVLKVDNIASA